MGHHAAVLLLMVKAVVGQGVAVPAPCADIAAMLEDSPILAYVAFFPHRGVGWGSHPVC